METAQNLKRTLSDAIVALQATSLQIDWPIREDFAALLTVLRIQGAVERLGQYPEVYKRGLQIKDFKGGYIFSSSGSDVPVTHFDLLSHIPHELDTRHACIYEFLSLLSKYRKVMENAMSLGVRFVLINRGHVSTQKGVPCAYVVFDKKGRVAVDEVILSKDVLWRPTDVFVFRDPASR